MEEKRKSPRVRVSAQVTLRLQAARLAGGSRVKDISETGICIPSKTYYAVGSLIELEVRAEDLSEPFKVLARVVRIANRDRSKFPFELGLVFLHLPVAERDFLHEYIKRSIVHGDQDISWLD